MENNLLSFLLTINLKACALIGTCLLLSLSLKNFWAIYRQGLIRCAVGLLIILPALSLIVPSVSMLSIELPVYRQAQANASTSTHSNPIAQNLANSLPVREKIQTLPTTNTTNADASNRAISADAQQKPFSWAMLVLTVYLSVSCLFIIQLVLGLIRGYRRISKMEDFHGIEWQSQVDVRVPHTIKVRLNPNDETPFVWGFLKPVIVLPNHFQFYDLATRQNVLRHELVHIHNQDWLWAIIGKLCCCLYWLNPMVWAAIRSSNLESEKICDEQVLSTGASQENYAEQLVTIAKTLRSPTAGTAMAPSMTRPSVLRRRIDNILMNRRRRAMKPLTQNIVKLIFLLTSVSLIAINSQSQAPANQLDAIKEPEPFAKYVALQRVEPKYPVSAVNRGIEGHTVLEFSILPSGKVGNVQVVESEPAGLFDQASLNAIQHWLYLPDYKEGKAVETKGVRTRLSYKLDGRPRVAITPAELEHLEQQGPQTADEALSVIKYYFAAKRRELATTALITYLNRVEKGEAENALWLIQSLSYKEFDAQPIDVYMSHLQNIVDESSNGDAYALLAQFYRSQKNWPAAQLALAKAFERGQLSEPMETKITLMAVLFNIHNYDAALSVVDSLIAEYGETETLIAWRDAIKAEDRRRQLVTQQLLSQAIH